MSSRPIPGEVNAAVQSPPVAIPLRYMLFGVLGFAAFAVDLVLQSANLGRGLAFHAPVVAMTHILTLCALLSFVMGAVYQLSTVAFLIPIQSVRLASLNFWLFALSAITLVIAMGDRLVLLRLIAGTGAVTALYIYCINIILSISKTKVKGAMAAFVISAHGFLIIAISMAWMMVSNHAIPAFAIVDTKLLLTHITTAIGGFFTFLAFGFSYKLLPMFTLSHGFPERRPWWTFGFLQAAIWLILIGIWSDVPLVCWTAIPFALAAFTNHLLQIRTILRKRLRKVLELPIQSVIAAVVLGIAGILAFALQSLFHTGVVGWQSVVMFYLIGCITLMVLSYAYKIVPFLVWTKNYSKLAKTEQKKTLIRDLLDLRTVRPILGVFGLGLILLTFGAWLGLVVIAIIGTGLLGISLMIFCIQMYSVLRLRIGERGQKA